MATLKLTNTEINFLYQWLNIPLHGEQIRARNRFLKIIQKDFDAIHPTRIAMIEKYASKDAEGKPVLKDKLYDIPEDKQEEAKAELTKFLDTENEYPVNKETKQDYIEIGKVLKEKLTQGFNIDQGKLYDEVVTKFEAIK